MRTLIRPETAQDYTSIVGVNRAAFDGEVEAVLVERLRGDGLVIASLVAVDDNQQVVGHILFSPVTVITASHKIQVASLAPMAVLPSHQRRGIGSMLVEHGIEACRRSQYSAIVVVGHPKYYPRFGFSHALVARLQNPFAVNDAFMGLELVRGVLSGIEGRIVYSSAFAALS